jgi:hypothetical protein
VELRAVRPADQRDSVVLDPRARALTARLDLESPGPGSDLLARVFLDRDSPQPELPALTMAHVGEPSGHALFQKLAASRGAPKEWESMAVWPEETMVTAMFAPASVVSVQ